MATAQKSARKPKTSTKTRKKTTAKAPVKKSKNEPRYDSFKVSKSDAPFTTLKITRQTVYWVILIAFIIFAQLWILKLQIDVAQLIDAQAASLAL